MFSKYSFFGLDVGLDAAPPSLCLVMRYMPAGSFELFTRKQCQFLSEFVEFIPILFCIVINVNYRVHQMNLLG
jgi:hypothetical protein